MDFDSVQSIPLHHAFEIHNGVFVRRVGVSNPSVKVANGTVSPAGGARGVVGDELHPLIHVSSVDPSITRTHAVGFGQVRTEGATRFHDHGQRLAPG